MPWLALWIVVSIAGVAGIVVTANRVRVRPACGT